MNLRLGRLWTLIVVVLVLGIPVGAATGSDLINIHTPVGVGKLPVANNMAVELLSNCNYKGKLNATNAKTYNIITKTKHGFLILNKTGGNFIYTPNINFTGNDSFTYNVNNGTKNSNTATVKITIKPLPDGHKTIYVAINGTDRNDGLTAAHPKRNIITAINVADPGDTIKIGPGTYSDIPIDINKNITLSGTSQNSTIIDAQQQVNKCIIIHAGVNVSINDITIGNSNICANPYLYSYSGAGIFNEGELTITRSTIKDNKAKSGAGIENRGILMLNQVIIKNNTSMDGFGGGIDNDYGIAIIKDSIITNNVVVGYGGGIYAIGAMKITNSTISNNIATGDGGGISAHGELTMEDSVITNNTVIDGPGGGLSTNNLHLFGSIVCNNKASTVGGIYNQNKAYVDDQTIVINNTPTNFGGAPITPA